MCIGLHVQYRYSRQLSMKVEYSREIFEKYLNFMKIRPVGADLFHTDRQTIAFRNFAYALENRIVNAVSSNNLCLRDTYALCGHEVQFMNVNLAVSKVGTITGL